MCTVCTRDGSRGVYYTFCIVKLNTALDSYNHCNIKSSLIQRRTHTHVLHELNF